MASTKVPGEFVGMWFPEGTTVFVDSQYHAWKRWPNGREEVLTKNRAWVMGFIKSGDWWPASGKPKEKPHNERHVQRSVDSGPPEPQAGTDASGDTANQG